MLSICKYKCVFVPFSGFAFLSSLGADGIGLHLQVCMFLHHAMTNDTELQFCLLSCRLMDFGAVWSHMSRDMICKSKIIRAYEGMR